MKRKDALNKIEYAKHGEMTPEGYIRHTCQECTKKDRCGMMKIGCVTRKEDDTRREDRSTR